MEWKEALGSWCCSTVAHVLDACVSGMRRAVSICFCKRHKQHDGTVSVRTGDTNIIQDSKNKTEELEMEIVYFLFFISEESI